MVLSTGMNNVPGQPRCPLCKETFNSKNEFEDHKSTPGHRAKWLKHWYHSQRYLLASNKNGVEVRPNNNIENVDYEERNGTVTILLQPGGQKTFDILVKSAKDSNPVILRQIESLHATRRVNLSDQYDVTRNAKFVRILPGIEYAVKCHVEAGMVGVEMVPFAFQFKAEDDSLFFIVRTIEVMVVDSIAKDCGPCTPYQPMKPKFYSRHDRGTYIPGVPVAAGESQQYKPRRISLGRFNYRAGLRHIAAKNFNPKHCGSNENELREVNKLQKMMKEGLTSSNYVEWFQTMLWLEEMQMEIDIQYYTMAEARLKNVSQLQYSKAHCVELEVLGLAENRPSVLRGDSVFVTHLGTKKPVYEGVVHQVNEKSIYLAFDSQFMTSFIDNLKVSVEFTFNRYPLRVSHRAAVLSKELSLFHLTFPVFSPGNGPPTLQNILPYNRKIQNNLEQMEAVSNIVAGTSRPSPYIIFGPPGTGKTVTVVEAIKQVYKLQPLSRVLAAAPSNAAADLIARRLQEHVSKNHMHRFHAQSRPYSSIPNELLDISNVQDRSVYLPNDDDLKNFRIIICTFVTAARIASASFPPGHITHVFLDECGHSMEPECIAALAGIIENDGQVVLAGDPHQLGPVIRNQQCFSSGKHFSNNGLDKSYLERLMEREMYQPSEGQFNRKVVTKLLNNYRSHKDILTKSNEMFYDNELKVCADQMLTMSLCNWEHLPKRNFPLIFHAVRGKDEREGRSPSFFNTLEVSAVIDYTKKLLDSRNPKIMPKEIGIITPYRRQVEKIKQQLTKAKIGRDVKVGSPEEFQGDERRVIIISSVRASADQLADDQIFKLGFLRNPKRFNVAVTRAKALLILVGCPEILHLDEHWGKLLDFIRENGGYRGAPLMKESQDLDDILSRFDNLNLRPVLSEEVSARELAEAPEWRVEY